MIILIFSLLAKAAIHSDFVSVTELDPSIQLEMRYNSNNNFVGAKIDGNKADKCYQTKASAEALAKVQKELKPYHLSLKMYDCYRPQKAVSHFVRWARDLKDTKMKKQFYPKLDKSVLFKEGYIAEKSGHSRGSTVDLTLVATPSNKILEMGTTYDFFDPIANTENQTVGHKELQNRLLLKAVMEKNGFKNYNMEWWHFTLNNEPYPSTFFDFDVE
jgi:D-alanyl-D-alanine dipeptidase